MTVICLRVLPLGTGAGELNDTTIPSVYSTVPPVNYTPVDATIYGQLAGIDNELGLLSAGSSVALGAVNPTGVVTPTFIGQLYINTATFTQWIATTAVNTGWLQQANSAQSGVGSPVAAVTPRYVGDIYVRTSDDSIWCAYGTANTEWTAFLESVVTGATSPVGAVLPAFLGQRYIDTTADNVWIAYGALITEWYLLANAAQSGAGTPVATVVPRYVGDLYLQTTGNVVWFAYGLLNTNWVMLTDTVASGVLAPHGAVTPAFIGQRYVDTATARMWIAHGTLNTTWSLAANRGPGGLSLSETGVITTGDNNIVLGGVAGSVANSTAAATIAGDSALIDNSDRAVVLAGQNVQIEDANYAIAGGNGAQTRQASSIVIGANARAYAGNGTPTGGIALGPDAQVYGHLGAIALSGGAAFGERSLAFGSSEVRTIGGGSLAWGGSDVTTPQIYGEVGGQYAIGFGRANQVHGRTSAAFGSDCLIGTAVGKDATLTNVAGDLEIVVTGEDLTPYVAALDNVFVYKLTGGTHDPDVDTNVMYLLVDSVVFAAGDTTITVLGAGAGLTATNGRLVLPEQVLEGFAAGLGNTVHTGSDFSAVFGEESETNGTHCFAMGYQAAAGVTSVDDGAVALGIRAKAYTAFSQAFGQDAQTRNKGELARASQQWSGIEWSQLRMVDVHRDIATGTGTANLYTDAAAAGTEEFATFAGHAYLVTAYVIGIIDAGAGTRKTAAWRLEGLFKNEGGTVAQVGATTTTLIANDDIARFDTNPVFAVSTSKIRVTAADDGTGAATVRWMTHMHAVELGT